MNLEETSLLFRCKMGFADAHDRRTFRRTFQFTYALVPRIPFRKFRELFCRNLKPAKFRQNGILILAGSPAKIHSTEFPEFRGFEQESVEDSKDLHESKSSKRFAGFFMEACHGSQLDPTRGCKGNCA